MLKRIIVILLFVFQLFMVGCGPSSSGTSKCTICGKPATHTFQGSGYCNTHYNDAVNWALKHPKK